MIEVYTTLADKILYIAIEQYCYVQFEDYNKIKRVTKGKFGRNWQALN